MGSGEWEWGVTAEEFNHSSLPTPHSSLPVPVGGKGLALRYARHWVVKRITSAPGRMRWMLSRHSSRDEKQSSRWLTGVVAGSALASDRGRLATPASRYYCGALQLNSIALARRGMVIS